MNSLMYGFQRLVLLGSAGYLRAELPLDDSVSLIAPNNTGKTSLINALQFLLIIDKRRMDFGAHDVDKTRRFYFPSNSAYILLEVSLPQSGTVVIGCVGKGVSHDYEYFAYQGPLHVDEYRLPNGKLVAQPQLVQHMAEQQRLVYRYTPTEFRDLIYGGRRTKAANEPDFTVFKLEHASDAQAFQQVLTRTLRLDKLTSAEVKHYLLQIFKRDLPDANIDFKREWDKAFTEVNAERAQYQAAERLLPIIRDLEKTHEHRLMLRGKLLEWRPRIDAALTCWQSHYDQQSERLQLHLAQLKDEQQQQTTKDRELTAARIQREEAKRTLHEANQRQALLADKLTLIQHRQQLEDQLSATTRLLEQHITRLGQVSGRSLQAIVREQQQRQQQLSQLEQQAHHADNAYSRLRQLLSAEDLDRLNRLLNGQIMTLGHDAVTVDRNELQTLLQTQTDDYLTLPGLQVARATLTPQHQQLTRQELSEQIDDMREQLQSLHEQRLVAETLEEAAQKKRSLEQEVQQIRQDLADYDALQTLKAAEPARQLQWTELDEALNDIQAQLAQSQALFDQRQQTIDELRQQQSTLLQQHQTIDRIRHQRIDHGEPFSSLADTLHHPWLAESEWPMESLAERLTTYHQDCRELLELEQRTLRALSDIHSQGLTKYQYSSTPDQEISAIVDFSHQLPQEKVALEKKARSAVVNVTASLRELRDGLLAFQGKMREFNRLLGHRQLSDLKTFKIDAQEEQYLVDAINTLITTAASVDSGDNFDLFNQVSVLDDQQVDRAKQVLIDEGNARQGLKVADLFRLEFVVAKIDQPAESFADIDSAASNGTVLMAKLITGLAMLHLMQDQRQRVRAICYLDEALALDARNQRSLIDTAHDFGFALIFASPAPLTTVRYCVPIHHHAGMNHINRESWQILEPLPTPQGAHPQ